MKTAFATLLVAATAANSAATDVALIACTDNTPTSSAGCLNGTYTTIDDNSTLHWQWMLKASSSTAYKTITSKYAYCNYLSIPYGDLTMQQSLANCGWNNAGTIEETVQTYASSATATSSTYSHWYTSTSSSFLQGNSKAQTDLWVDDADVAFTVAQDESGNWLNWSGCAMRPFEDSTLALAAGEKINVKGSMYIWKSNAATTASGRLWGAQGSLVETEILDKADGATTLAAAAAVAAVAALSF